MREIKFRMWIPGTEEESAQMISGDDLAFDEYFPIRDILTREGIMQYTGLKDKNGKEIYEGDIVRYWWSRRRTGQVTFKDGSFMVDCYRLSECPDDTEVIGNIYEHSHLLSDT